jgi:acyl dehydratase
MQKSPQTVLEGIDALLDRVGQELGVGEWHEITQRDVDAFADVTHDHQWIHIDPERATASPFGGTIAHGYFTLSLIPFLQAGIFKVDNITHALNYGLDRVRFPAPVPVGSSVRARVTLCEVTPREGGADGKYETVIESTASERPVAVVQTLVRYYGESRAAADA